MFSKETSGMKWVKKGKHWYEIGLALSSIMLTNGQTYLKNLEHLKIFKVCLFIFQHYG